jgi:hypothetical protein
MENNMTDQEIEALLVRMVEALERIASSGNCPAYDGSTQRDIAEAALEETK